MTKAQLISSVSSRFTVVVNIAKVLLGINDVINEGYSSPITDNSTSETYTTQNTASITYGVQFNKAFRAIRANGSFTNTGSISLPVGTEIFAFKTNEFKGSTSEFIGIGATYTPYKLSSNDVIPAGATIKFFVTYNADN